MNKKMIVLIEIVMCVIAIVVVSIFGNNPETWRYFEYCKSISFFDDNVELPEGTSSYQLKWKIGPVSATVNDVAFTADSKIVDIDKNGLVTFKVRQGVTVTVMTTDGSELKDTITLKFKAPSSGTIVLD